MTKSFNRFNSTSALRGGSAFVVASLLVPLAGCGSPAPPPTTSSAPPPAIGAVNPNRPSMGLSGKQKVVLLTGAAALFYYYQKSKKATAAQYGGQAVQYYRSKKNGGIYYRDPKTHEAHYVTAPTGNYQQSVDPSVLQGQDYNGIQQAQGYNNQKTGNGLDYYFKPAPGGNQ